MAAYFGQAFPNLRDTVYSNDIFHEIVKETGFENDKRMQKQLSVFYNAFISAIETEGGNLVVYSLEEVVNSIKDKNTFISSIKVIFQLVQNLDLRPTDKFGLFLGSLGIIIGLVSQLDISTPASIGLQRIISQTYNLIFCTVLAPLWNGTKNSIESFFECKFIDALNVDI